MRELRVVKIIKIGEDKYINIEHIAYCAKGFYGGSGMTIGFVGGAGAAREGTFQLTPQETKEFQKWLDSQCIEKLSLDG